MSKTNRLATKTITKAEWATYQTVSAATTTTGTVKRDSDGDCWTWVSSGKRITITKGGK